MKGTTVINFRIFTMSGPVAQSVAKLIAGLGCNFEPGPVPYFPGD